jgi:hypothetical protein
VLTCRHTIYLVLHACVYPISLIALDDTPPPPPHTHTTTHTTTFTAHTAPPPLTTHIPTTHTHTHNAARRTWKEDNCKGRLDDNQPRACSTLTHRQSAKSRTVVCSLANSRVSSCGGPHSKHQGHARCVCFPAPFKSLTCVLERWLSVSTPCNLLQCTAVLQPKSSVCLVVIDKCLAAAAAFTVTPAPFSATADCR